MITEKKKRFFFVGLLQLMAYENRSRYLWTLEVHSTWTWELQVLLEEHKFDDFAYSATITLVYYNEIIVIYFSFLVEDFICKQKGCHFLKPLKLTQELSQKMSYSSELWSGS